MAKDPAGFIDDVGMFVTGGASALTKVAKAGSKLEKGLKVASNVGKGADLSSKPFQVAGKTIGKAKDWVAPKNPGAEFYAKLAPHLTTTGMTDVGKTDEMFKYFVDNGLSVNRKVMKQMKTASDTAGKRIGELVDEATKRGGEIPTEEVIKVYHDMLKEPGRHGIADDLGKNREFLQEGHTAKLKEYGDTMTVRQLQDLKQSINKFKANLADTMGNVTAKVNKELFKNSQTILNDIFKNTDYAKQNKKLGMSNDIETVINDTIQSMQKNGGWSKSGLLQGGLAKIASSAGLALAGIGAMGGIAGGITFVGALGAIAIFSNSHVQTRMINKMAKLGKKRKSLAAKEWKMFFDKYKGEVERQIKNAALQTTKAERE